MTYLYLKNMIDKLSITNYNIYRVDMNEKFKYRNDIEIRNQRYRNQEAKKKNRRTSFLRCLNFPSFQTKKNIASRSTDGADRTNTLKHVQNRKNFGSRFEHISLITIMIVFKRIGGYILNGYFFEFDENDIKC